MQTIQDFSTNAWNFTITQLSDAVDWAGRQVSSLDLSNTVLQPASEKAAVLWEATKKYFFVVVAFMGTALGAALGCGAVTIACSAIKLNVDLSDHPHLHMGLEILSVVAGVATVVFAGIAAGILEVSFK